MKSKLLFGVLVAFVVNACEKKISAVQTETTLFEKTSKDTTQTEYVRKGASVFMGIISKKPGISREELRVSHVAMVCSRNPITITTYVAFLKKLEEQLPDELPAAEIYASMKSRAGTATMIEYNVAQTVIMMSNSIENISLYGDPTADREVEGVLKRLKEKHGTSETGTKILEFLNIVHTQGLEARGRGIKPWESPGRSGSMD